MALADTAKLLVELAIADNMTSKLGSIDKSLSAFGKNATSVSQKIGADFKAGIGTTIANLERLAVAGVGSLAGAVGKGVASLSELSTAQQQTAAVIASTGAKAGVTAQQVRDLANSLEDVTTVDDKVVQSGENMLLTFTNIGADAFPQATKAIVDMAIAMNNGSVEGLDLSKTAIQVGKALNDPIEGATALKKVGVTLTDQQKEQIKTFMEAGKVYEAQQVILKELETEFGNAGKAAGQDFGSGMRRLQNVGEGLSVALATGLMPVITKATTWLSTKLASPAIQAQVKALGDELARVGDKVLAWLDRVDWDGLGRSLGDMLGTARNIGSTLVGGFNAMPDWVKQAVVTGWGLNALSGGAVVKIGVDIAQGVFGQFIQRGSSPANPMFVSGGLGGAGGGAAGASGLLGLVGKAFVAISIVAVVAEVLQALKAAGDASGNKDLQKFQGHDAPVEKNVSAGFRAEANGGGGAAVGKAAIGAMQDTMDNPLFWSRMSLASQLGLQQKYSDGGSLDKEYQRGSLYAANLLVNGGLVTNEKLEGLANIQARLLENGTAGDKAIAAQIAVLAAKVEAARPMTAGEMERTLRANITPPTVNVNVTMGVSLMSGDTSSSSGATVNRYTQSGSYTYTPGGKLGL